MRHIQETNYLRHVTDTKTSWCSFKFIGTVHYCMLVFEYPKFQEILLNNSQRRNVAVRSVVPKAFIWEKFIERFFSTLEGECLKKSKKIPEMWLRSKESISLVLCQFEGLAKWLLDRVSFLKYSYIMTHEKQPKLVIMPVQLTLRFHCFWPGVSHHLPAYFCCHFEYPYAWTSLWTLHGNYILEHIHRLSYSFDVLFNVCWGQHLMDIGLGWSNGHRVEKKLPVHTTSCVTENPSLCHGKINAQPDVASSHLSVEINCDLDGFASFVPGPKRITSPN